MWSPRARGNRQELSWSQGWLGLGVTSPAVSLSVDGRKSLQMKWCQDEESEVVMWRKYRSWKKPEEVKVTGKRWLLKLGCKCQPFMLCTVSLFSSTIKWQFPSGCILFLTQASWVCICVCAHTSSTHRDMFYWSLMSVMVFFRRVWITQEGKACPFFLFFFLMFTVSLSYLILPVGVHFFL